MRAAVATGAALTGLTAVFRENDEGAAEERLRVCQELVPELTSTCTLAILQGPQDVTAIAINFCNAIDEMLEIADQWKNAIIANNPSKAEELSTEYNEKREEVNNYANEFAEAANAVLVKEEASIEAP
jgi:hypothetical protein